MVIPKSKTFFTNATPPSVGRPFSLTFGDHFAMSNQSLEPAFHRHLPGRILSRGIREQALELFEQGLGHKSVAKRLAISPHTTRDWGRAFRENRFFPTVSKHLYCYDDDAKSAVWDLSLKGFTISEIAEKTHISRSTCYAWIRAKRDANARRTS